jgi:hypothetical protein
MAILDGFLSYTLPTEVSLLVVLGLIGGSILLSLVKPPTKGQQEAEQAAKDSRTN